jgi:hypothetical protein
VDALNAMNVDAAKQGYLSHGSSTWADNSASSIRVDLNSRVATVADAGRIAEKHSRRKPIRDHCPTITPFHHLVHRRLLLPNSALPREKSAEKSKLSLVWTMLRYRCCSRMQRCMLRNSKGDIPFGQRIASLRPFATRSSMATLGICAFSYNPRPESPPSIPRSLFNPSRRSPWLPTTLRNTCRVLITLDLRCRRSPLKLAPSTPRH